MREGRRNSSEPCLDINNGTFGRILQFRNLFRQISLYLLKRAYLFFKFFFFCFLERSLDLNLCNCFFHIFYSCSMIVLVKNVVPSSKRISLSIISSKSLYGIRNRRFKGQDFALIPLFILFELNSKIIQVSFEGISSYSLGGLPINHMQLISLEKRPV